MSGWQNTITGLGTSADKATGARYSRKIWNSFDLELYADAFCRDDLVSRIASAAPAAMFARDYQVMRGDDRLLSVEERLDELQASAMLERALTWQNLFGGSALLVGANDGRQKNEPLDPLAVREIRFLADLDRREIYKTGPLDQRVTLAFSRGTLSVHRSRLIWFDGRPCPRRERRERGYWGIGLIETVWDEIGDFQLTWKSIRHLLTDGAQGKFKIKGLIEALSSGEEDAIYQRMKWLNLYKSIVQGLVLDFDSEEYSRDTLSLSGYDSMLDKAFERLSLATGIPQTVLLGRSPGGMNSTGDSDLTLWYEYVAEQRKRFAEPALIQLAKLVAVAEGEDPDGISIVWDPFWTPDAGEIATVDQTKANTLASLAGTLAQLVSDGIISASERTAKIRSMLELEAH